VVRVGCLLERVQVTASTLNRRSHELAVEMAGRTGNRGVRAGKRKAGRRVIEADIGPGIGRVAQRAVRGEARGYVIGIAGGGEIGGMAAEARGRGPLISIRDVAGGTG